MKTNAFLIGCALGLAAAGCAHTGDPLSLSGQALKTTGEQFEATSAAFVALCSSHTLAKPTCDDYTAFGQKFKPAYNLAVTGWFLAGMDGGLADTMAWSELLNQLASFTTIAVHAAVPAADGGN